MKLHNANLYMCTCVLTHTKHTHIYVCIPGDPELQKYLNVNLENYVQ